MACDGVLPDVAPSRDDLPWPERVPQALGIFATLLGVVVALQRHEFTSPNYKLAVIALVVSPWFLDMFARTRNLLRDGEREFQLLTLWSAVVLAGVFWLMHTYHGPDDFTPFVVTLLVGEMAATGGPRFGALVLAAGAAELIVFTTVFHYYGMYIWGFAFIIAWMGGTAFRSQVDTTYALTEAQARLTAQAAEEERHRLARDVHDLIAHSLAVTMLQLSGARLALQAGDTDDALAALSDAESAGRAAMAEIHRTMGLLGTSGSGQVPPPTPSAADVPGLVAAFRRAGLTVDFALEGDLGEVPMATGLASYRLVQESLSNAVKHAPGAPVHLLVQVTESDIRIHVVNPVERRAPTGEGRGAEPGGNGLRGMAERAELLGGVAVAGNGDGTWKVEACIPWSAVSA